MNSVAYITHPAFLQHEMGQHHPESPARLHAISDQLIAAGIEPFLLHRDAMQATREQIERIADRELGMDASGLQEGKPA